MKRLLLFLIPLALSGCLSDSEFSVPIPVGPAPVSQPAQPVRPIAPGAHKMIDDPDALTEEWDDQIFADSLSEANSICRQRADNMSTSGGARVESLGATQVSGKLYRCRFRSEVAQ